MKKIIIQMFLAACFVFTAQNNVAHNNDQFLMDGSYLGAQYSRAIGINSYLIDVVDGDEKQSGFMKHFDGYGINLNYIRDMNSDFFTEFKFGYNKKTNDINDNVNRFEEKYKMYDGLISFGKFIDMGCNIYPYGSIGLGMALIKNEFNMYDFSGGSMAMVLNSKDDDIVVVPEIAYELGLAFTTNSGIITVSYNQKILKDLEYKKIPMYGPDGKIATNLDFNSKFNTYNVAIGFKFPV